MRNYSVDEEKKRLVSHHSRSMQLARERLHQAEAALIADIPGCTSSDVDLEDGESSLHAIELRVEGAASAEVLVLLPGYGAGAGAFFMALGTFARMGVDCPFGTVYALDWPGTGLSSPFRREKLLDDGLEGSGLSLASLLAYAVGALDAWRIKVIGPNNKGLTLLGHSVGGYLAFVYCEQLEQRRRDGGHAAVKHLILASPAGVPTHPAARAPPISEEAWLTRKAADLEQGRRPKTNFDRGGRSLTRLR